MFFWRARAAHHFADGTQTAERNCAIWNGKYAGGVAGGLQSSSGYIRISIDNCRYRAHRLAWLYMTGSMPPEQIDHKNGIRSDNRFSNLRLATNAENHQNLRPPSHNTSGHIGVAWHKRGGKWRAEICLNGQRRYLGLFETREAAAGAYLAAKAALHTFQPMPRSA